MWETCKGCERPMVCKPNLLKLRVIFGGSVVATGVLGAIALPLIGFGLGGVAAGSAAAAWQSSIGAVQAGSMFAILQSLGATGLGSLISGGTGTALTLLGTLAVKLDWCNNAEASVKIKKSKETCGCTTTFKLTACHIENLSAVQTEKFELKGNKWILAMRKSECLSIGLVSEKSCKVKVAAKISSENPQVSTIRKQSIEDIAAGDGFGMDDLITWMELLRAGNRYVKKTSFTMEIEMTDGMFFVDLCEKFEEKPKLESLFGRTESDVKPEKPNSSSWSFWKPKSSGMLPTLNITKTKKSCNDGCLTILELTVDNIKNVRTLGSRPSNEMKIGKTTWKLEVSNYNADYVGLKLRGDKECEVRMVVQIRSESASVNCIRKVIIRHIEPNNDLCVDKLLLWRELVDPRSAYIQDSALKIEVELTNGSYIRGHTSSF